MQLSCRPIGNALLKCEPFAESLHQVWFRSLLRIDNSVGSASGQS